jgi:hypothetical protein
LESWETLQTVYRETNTLRVALTPRVYVCARPDSPSALAITHLLMGSESATMILTSDDTTDEDELRAERAREYAQNPTMTAVEAADKGIALMALCWQAGVPFDPARFRDMSNSRIPADLLHALAWGMAYRLNPPETDTERDSAKTYIARFAPGDATPNDVPDPETFAPWT